MHSPQWKLSFLSLLTLCLALAPYAADAGTIDRTYWDQAVALADENACLTPLNIVETEKVSATDGKPVERNVTHLQVVHQDGRDLDIKLISREENGKNTTEKFYRDFIAHKEETLDELKEEGVFAKTAQDLIKLTGLSLQGKVATYTFTIDVDGLAFTGQAKICAIEGHALTTTVTTPEMEEDGVVIRDYTEVTRFKRDGDRWFPDKVIETMDIEMGGFFTAFKGRIEAETILADYFCHP